MTEKVKAGQRFVFHPRGMDRDNPGVTLRDGDVVTITKEGRRLISFGHVHVLKDGAYAGHVWLGSLDPIPAPAIKHAAAGPRCICEAISGGWNCSPACDACQTHPETCRIATSKGNSLLGHHGGLLGQGVLAGNGPILRAARSLTKHAPEIRSHMLTYKYEITDNAALGVVRGKITAENANAAREAIALEYGMQPSDVRIKRLTR